MSRESSSEHLPHISSPTYSKSPHSSPKRSKRKLSKDLDEIIARIMKFSMGQVYDQINDLIRKTVKQEELIEEQNVVINELNPEIVNLKGEITTTNSQVSNLKGEIVTLTSSHLETQDR